MTSLSQPELYPSITLGVSACVIGEKVRYDGGHKRFKFLIDELADFVSFKPFCPEVAAGMGIPRAPIRLVSTEQGVRVKGTQDATLDVTEQLTQAADRLTQTAQGLTGFVFCAKSPSCGMERVKLYSEQGHSLPGGQPGIFADKLMQAYPSLPCEETGRLNDLLLRESFLNRLFCFGRWQSLLEGGLTAKGLIEFHTSHKLLLMAHSVNHYQQAGQLLDDLRPEQLESRASQYIQTLMDGLKVAATRKKHTNVLMHIQGYFKKHLDGLDRKMLTEMILRYQKGMLPLSAPLELLGQHLCRHQNDYLQLQHYFRPYPEPLKVRTII